MRRSALQKGLGWLSEHFGYDNPNRRQGTPAATAGATKGAAATRTRRPGLDVLFSPERDGRPAPEGVTASVTRLLGKPPVTPVD
jgi:hypothetical protein